MLVANFKKIDFGGEARLVREESLVQVLLRAAQVERLDGIEQKSLLYQLALVILLREEDVANTNVKYR